MTKTKQALAHQEYLNMSNQAQIQSKPLVDIVLKLADQYGIYKRNSRSEVTKRMSISVKRQSRLKFDNTNSDSSSRSSVGKVDVNIDPMDKRLVRINKLKQQTKNIKSLNTKSYIKTKKLGQAKEF
jgi:hypothetical protein